MTDIVIDLLGPVGRTALKAAARAEAAADGAVDAVSTIRAGVNTALGDESIASVTTGTANAGFGALALRDLTSGNNNTAVGDQALRELETGSSNVGIGVGAERLSLAGSRNTTIGSEAALSRTSGNDNVTVGFGAQGEVAAGSDFNVAVGRSAMRNVTGEGNIAVGYFAMTEGAQVLEVSNSIALGQSAVTTRSNQIALGNANSDEITFFGQTMFRKAGVLSFFAGNAGNYTATGGANVVIGHTAGFSLANADSNTLVGYECGYNLTSGGNNVAVGRSALLSATTGRDCTAIGAGALNKMVDGVGTTAVGRYSLQCLVDGGNNTAIGDASGRNLAGEQNCLMGYGTMRFGYANSYNVVIGQGALYNAGKASGTQPEDGGTPGALTRAIGVVTGPHSPSNFNAIVGHLAFELTTGGGHTGLGANAGRTLTGGSDMICIGRNAGFGSGQKLDATGGIAIGVGAVTTRDNEIVIGKSTDTHVTLAGVEFTKTQLEALLALAA